MKFKLQLSIICLFLVSFFLPQTGTGDVSVPWVSKDYHAHADVSISNNYSPPYSDSDSDDSYSPPLPLPISAAASVSRTSPPPQSANSSGTITNGDMEVMISVSDNSEVYAGGSATNDFIGSFFATAPVFQFSYSYDYDISVYCGDYPYDYYADNNISANIKITDKTDSVILYDGPIINASISCNSLVNPGTSSDIDSGSGVIAVPVIVGHEIEVEFGNSGYIDASGCTAAGDTAFTLQYDTSEQIQANAPVPWNSEDYHAHGDASYWNSTSYECPPDSGSDSDDAYSPPLLLPINASASVSYCPVSFGPSWWPGYGQSADGYGAITTSEMNIHSSVYDILGDPDDPNYPTDVSAGALDEFFGSFTATHDLFQFSYSYVYSMGADCCGLYPPEYYVYADTGVRGWVKVTDLTDSVILLDQTFLDAGAGCYADVSGSGSDQLFVPVTVGHDIKVEFGIDGNSSASGSYSMGSSDLTLQYDSVMRCIDPPVINDRTSEYYASLQDGYDDPAMLDGDIIKSQALGIPGDLVLNRDISVIFESGYNCDYSAIIGNTTVNGNMTISDGMLTIQSGTLEVI